MAEKKEIRISIDKKTAVYIAKYADHFELSVSEAVEKLINTAASRRAALARYAANQGGGKKARASGTKSAPKKRKAKAKSKKKAPEARVADGKTKAERMAERALRAERKAAAAEANGLAEAQA